MQSVELHLHTSFSLLDGLNTPSEYMVRAKELGMTHLAVTDHGTLASHRGFQRAARDAGIRPILGVEFYISATDRFDRRAKDKRQDGTQTFNHLTVLAQNDNGLRNLHRLSELAWTEGFYSKPRIDLDILEEYNSGLIVLSGCLNGLIAKSVANGLPVQANAFASEFKRIFRDRFFIEIQGHNPVEINKALLEVAENNKISPVVTSDCHYANKEDLWIEEAMLILATNPKVSKEAEFSKSQKMDMLERFNYLYPARQMTFQEYQIFLRSAEEHSALLRAQGIGDAAIHNTVRVAEMVGDYSLPENLSLLPEPKNENPDALLEKKARAGLRKLGLDKKPGYIERLNEELEIVKDKNFSSYFLIEANTVTWAKNQGIFIGPGRGSGAGSLLNLTLGITSVDPIEHNLLFFRFINPDRNDYPDIDTDIDATRRHEVKDYLQRQYKNVASIATFNTFQGKNAVRDAARVFRVPLGDVNKALKGADWPSNMDFFQMWADTDPGREFEKKYPEVMYLAKFMYGRLRSQGMHAGGIVISKEPLSRYAPVQSAMDDQIKQRIPLVALDMNEAANLGLIKFDFLGVKNLTILSDTLASISKRHGVDLDLTKIDYSDPKVYSMLSEGYTKGVFQAEAAPYTSLLIKMGGVKNFDELVASNALVRPGAMNSSAGQAFIDRKEGRALIEYPHPDMQWFTKETYGNCIYQEQDIMTPLGPVPIKDIETGTMIQGESGLGRVTHKVNMGVKPIYNVRLSNGIIIKCTKDHRFLSTGGYYPIETLVGKLIASPGKIILEGGVSEPEKARTLAALIAEGHLSVRSSFNVANNDEGILAQLESDSKVFNNIGTRRYWNFRCNYLSYFKHDRHLDGYHSPSELKTFIRDLGLEGKDSHSKFIPDWVFSLDEESRAAFIGMYISCDGSVGRNFVKVRTVSRKIADGLVDILKSLGIHSGITTDSSGLNVFVLDFERYRKLIAPHIIGNKSNIEVCATSKKGHAPNIVAQAQLDSRLSKRAFDKSNRTSRGSYTNKSIIGRNFAERFGYDSDYIWNRVESVEYAGFDDVVYDITVDGQHSFIVGCSVAHNCIYQEQVMLTMTELAGMSMSDADKVRKIIGKKKDVSEFDEYKTKFIDGASTKVSKRVAERLWKDFEAHAGYSFNKSHAVAYSMVTYWTAWLKIHYPIEFMMAMLRREKDKDSRLDYLIEAKRLGIRVLLPHVNYSGIDFEIQTDSQGDHIRFGLSNIKYISSILGNRLMDARPFKNYQHLYDTITTKGSGLSTRVLGALNAVGAAAFEDHPRTGKERENFFEYLNIPAFETKDLHPRIKAQFRPLDEFSSDEAFITTGMVRAIKTGPGWTRLDVVDESGSAGVFINDPHNIEAGNMYVFLVSNNTVAKYVKVNELDSSDLNDFLMTPGYADIPDGMLRVIAFTSRVTKNGAKMADVVLSDAKKNLYSALVFPRQFPKAYSRCKPGAVLDIKLDKTRDGATFVDNIL